MLCTISITMNSLGTGPQAYMIEVPDELFMRHTMMYGDFKPDQLTDNEFRSCTLLGLRSTMKYVGPADDTDNQRKDKT